MDAQTYQTLNQTEPIILILIALLALVGLYVIAQRGQNKNTENLTQTLREVIKGTNDVASKQLTLTAELGNKLDRVNLDTTLNFAELNHALSGATEHADETAKSILTQGIKETRQIITEQSDRVIGELHQQIDKVIANVDKVWGEIVVIRNVAVGLRDKLDALSPPTPPAVSPVIKQPTD